ncbi:MAG: hypothetical protein LBU18_03450, partial [Treponema sp.]|nr:hypothetical protein [Treponema sp.]
GPENHSKPASPRKSGENVRISRSTVERMLQGERKNGDVVCKTAGYARRTNEGTQAAVYQVLNPLLNYFYPRTKLVDKTRDEQGKTKKVYDQPTAPGERLPAREEAPREAKDRLRAQRKWLNIVRLKDALAEAVDRLLKTAQRYRQVKTMAGILT